MYLILNKIVLAFTVIIDDTLDSIIVYSCVSGF